MIADATAIRVIDGLGQEVVQVDETGEHHDEPRAPRTLCKGQLGDQTREQHMPYQVKCRSKTHVRLLTEFAVFRLSLGNARSNLWRVNWSRRSVRCIVPLALLSGCGEPEGASLPELDQKPIPPESAEDRALHFRAENEYATTANSNFPLARFSQTITARIRPESIEGEQAVFTLRRGLESGTQFGLSDGRLTAWSVWGPRVFVQAENSLEPDRWYRVAFVQVTIDELEGLYDQRLYLDGELVAQGTQPPGARTPTSSWLGTFDGEQAQYFGWLDDLSFYARALSDAELSAQVAGESPDSKRLVASWSFNEASGSTIAYDRSGNDNHATLGDGIASLMPALSSAP